MLGSHFLWWLQCNHRKITRPQRNESSRVLPITPAQTKMARETQGHKLPGWVFNKGPTLKTLSGNPWGTPLTLESIFLAFLLSPSLNKLSLPLTLLCLARFILQPGETRTLRSCNKMAFGDSCIHVSSPVLFKHEPQMLHHVPASILNINRSC